MPGNRVDADRHAGPRDRGGAALGVRSRMTSSIGAIRRDGGRDVSGVEPAQVERCGLAAHVDSSGTRARPGCRGRRCASSCACIRRRSSGCDLRTIAAGERDDSCRRCRSPSGGHAHPPAALMHTRRDIANDRRQAVKIALKGGRYWPITQRTRGDGRQRRALPPEPARMQRPSREPRTDRRRHPGRLTGAGRLGRARKAGRAGARPGESIGARGRPAAHVRAPDRRRSAAHARPGAGAGPAQGHGRRGGKGSAGGGQPAARDQHGPGLLVVAACRCWT